MDSEATLPEVGGAPLRIRQATRYPWDGEVTVTLHPARATGFTLKLRIPDRTESELYSATPDLGGRFTVRVNGQPQSPKIERGYIALRREWKDGDRIELSLPMEVQRVKADPRVAANVGRVALQYGPLVYNVESVDLPSGKNLDALALAADAPLRAEWDDQLLGGVLAIRGAFADGTPLQAIPNYARLNRLPQHQPQWVHLANTYDGVTQRVYVNGRLAKSRQPRSAQHCRHAPDHRQRPVWPETAFQGHDRQAGHLQRGARREERRSTRRRQARHRRASVWKRNRCSPERTTRSTAPLPVVTPAEHRHLRQRAVDDERLGQGRRRQLVA